VNDRPFAVVTGASSGIGYELARVFAENGYDLLGNSASQQIQRAASDLRNINGSSVEVVQADLTTYDGVEELWRAIQETGRSVDAIAINAGVGVGGDFARETDLDAELKLIQLNVTSAVHLAKRVLPGMVARGVGRILFTSSIAGTMPTPLEAVYGASKAFVLSFSQSLRHELKDTGVTVTALQPGPTNTNFFHRAGMDHTKLGTEGKYKNDPREVAQQGFKALMEGKDHVFSSSLSTKSKANLGSSFPNPSRRGCTKNRPNLKPKENVNR
jgi:short-subunit dehydrogenase